jgi:hypothetical protein
MQQDVLSIFIYFNDRIAKRKALISSAKENAANGLAVAKPFGRGIHHKQFPLTEGFAVKPAYFHQWHC